MSGQLPSASPGSAADPPTTSTPSAPLPSFTLRPPSTSPFHTSSAAPTPAPTPSWIKGTWHVTHSTLPMWRNARNVRITYEPIRGSDPMRLDDLVTYNPLKSAKEKSVHGVDTPEAGGWAYHWRGKGLLMIATSRWEVLGYGMEEGGNEWVCTFFAKTLFTPAGLDFYSRAPKGLKEGTVKGLQEALKGLGHEDVAKLAGELFEVKIGEAE